MTLVLTDSMTRVMRLRWILPLAIGLALALLVVNELGYRRASASIEVGDEIQLQRAEVRRMQLLLQAAEKLSQQMPVLYVTGEESGAQVAPMTSPGRIFTDGVAYTDLDAWHATAAALRRDDPVHRVEAAGYVPFWAVTRHADILEVERQHERPRGILWDHLQPPQIREIPILERMGYA